MDGGKKTDAMPCRSIVEKSAMIGQPADIILVVDSSGSMGSAVDRIEEVLNGELAAVLESAGIDYQVILLANDVAIGPPLSTSGRFHHHVTAIGSGDGASFHNVLETYPQWSAWLRPDAVKVFLHFTDSADGNGESIQNYEGTFDEILVRDHADQFGMVPGRRFVYHAIIGLMENDPQTDPWLPTDPIVNGTCEAPELGRTGPGVGYQGVAVRTGGLRFPVCQFSHFNVVFNTIADAVIALATPPCTYALPSPPVGEELDLNTLAVLYLKEPGASPMYFERVSGPTTCRDGGFYLDSQSVRLCEQTCSVVTNNPQSEVDIAFGCYATPS